MAAETPGLLEVVHGFITALTAGSSTWLWYDRKRRDKRLDDHDKEIKSLSKEQIVHKTKFIDEQKARSVVREETLSLKEGHAELKGIMSEITKEVNAISVSQAAQMEILKNLAQKIDELKK